MERTSKLLRRFVVVLMAFAVVLAYSVVPMNQTYAATKKPTKITLAKSPNTKTIDVKGKVTLSVKSVKPAKASKAVTWKSSNPKVATVSKSGVVTGKKKGTVKITATSKSNKKVKSTVKLTVKQLKPKSITLNKSKATIKVGKTVTLKVKSIKPLGVYAPVTWSSSNKSVATVSKGKVTAKKAGTATITVKTTKASGKVVSAKCKVTVKKDRTVFVDLDYVKNIVKNKPANTVLAEVSWGPDAPEAVIPGSIHVNTDDLESTGQDVGYELWDLRGANNDFKELMDTLAGYGITKDTNLVCYSLGETSAEAPRLALAALMLGVNDVKVLDGGSQQWFDANLATAPASAPKKAASFGRTTPLHPEWIVDCDEVVKKVAEDPNFKLVSIRSYDEFIGKNSGYAYIDKAGEPKGAIWGRNTDDGSYFINGKTIGIDKLNEYLADYDASTENELAFYCGTGWRACFPFLICYQAGIDNMKFFDDGWYVYSGEFADEWNWVGEEPSKKVNADYPVQIGDPKKGDVTYTTVGELKDNLNAIRGLSVKKDVVNVNAAGTYASNFSAMPPKANIFDSLTFTSSDESIATVDAAGKVTVKDAAAGKTVTITATSNATSGSTRDKAGEPAHTESYTIKTTAGFNEMSADDWANYGINYDALDYTNDFVLDVRTAENYGKGHIVGSTNVSVAAGDIAEGDDVAKALDKAYEDAAGARIVIVCNSGQSLAKRAMEYYRTHGKDMSTITYLIGGAKGITEGEFKNNFGVAYEGIDLEKDVVVDLRNDDNFNAGHVKGSLRANVQGGMNDTVKADLDTALAKLTGSNKLVLVCIRGHGLAKQAMAYYQSAGADLTKITYLIGGATGLQASNPDALVTE